MICYNINRKTVYNVHLVNTIFKNFSCVFRSKISAFLSIFLLVARELTPLVRVENFGFSVYFLSVFDGLHQNPITVPEMTQERHEDGGELSQIVDSKWLTSPDLSPQEDSEFTEVTEQLLSYSSVRGKKAGDEPHTFPKPRPLKKPSRKTLPQLDERND